MGATDRKRRGSAAGCLLVAKAIGNAAGTSRVVSFLVILACQMDNLISWS